MLVQILPQVKQPDWTGTFNKLFNSGKIPQKWADMPPDYQKQQLDLIDKHDKEAAAAAAKNGLKPPDSLLKADQQMMTRVSGREYLMGAFPNFFEIPDYSSGKYKAGQAPGTQWYHAHKHGSTSLHILNGLAGALIIESSQPGGYDHIIRQYYGWGNAYGDHERSSSSSSSTRHRISSGPEPVVKASNKSSSMASSNRPSPCGPMRPNCGDW